MSNPHAGLLTARCQCDNYSWLKSKVKGGTAYTCRGCGLRSWIMDDGTVQDREREACPACHSKLRVYSKRSYEKVSFLECSYCHARYERFTGCSLRPAEDWPAKSGKSWKWRPAAQREVEKLARQEKEKNRLKARKDRALARRYSEVP